MNCELEFRNYARSRRAERPIPQIMAVRHAPPGGARRPAIKGERPGIEVTEAKIRRLGRLSEVDFEPRRPEVRPVPNHVR